ncbi:acylphosphatase [Emticicia soli]|uniref:DUF3185 family protein n=1 Tax=Emticicia soli TaxID=2027878 RepID=A0ABW5JAC6_9BACT
MKHIGTALILIGLGFGYYTHSIDTPDNVLTSPQNTDNLKDILLGITIIFIFGGLLVTMHGARKGAKDTNLS